MFYNLKDNVYLVTGACKSCLYDFNTQKLYSINKVLSAKIQLLNEGKLDSSSVDESLAKILTDFIDLNLITLSEHNHPHYIQEIQSNSSNIEMAWVELTNRCNLKCLHCYNESDSQKDTVMSFSDYKKVIDQLIELKVKKLQLIGGEPFTQKELLRNMLDYIVNKFPFIEIFTNGTLITPEWFEYLAKNHIHIAVSIYSYDPKVHDTVTGKNGSWLASNQMIQQLKSYGIRYRVCNVLMKNITLGEKCTDLYTLSSEKDIVRMSRRANFLLLSDELIRKQLITKETFQGKLQKKFCMRLLQGHNCFQSKLYIAANLDVFPCVMERRLKHCNIQESGKIVLNSAIQHLNKDKIKDCCCCEYRYLCFDCRPNSISNEILEKPWYCTYNPTTATWEDEDKFITALKLKWGS